VSRAAIDIQSRVGLIVTGSDSCGLASTILEDVDLVGCAGCSIGFDLRSEARVTLRRVRAAGADTGVHILGGAAEVADSQILDNTVGLSAPAGFDPASALRRVSFQQNAQDLLRR
jgi:hypothetical protein